eukprot:TRINITY_DN1154_c0_g1_i1.p1 TRINITY_DN1154_c0_g1~~TRINITY_DN1154_c0_g1_i1.p1  ORF type:complete len:171 (+),score=28.04 TRINITY_DN1154_c0_g1_i1:62-574(+)
MQALGPLKPATTPCPRVVVVSAKPRRPHLPTPRDDAAEEMGGLGFAVLTALDSNQPSRKASVIVPLNESQHGSQSSSNDKRMSWKSEKGGVVKKETSLSGLDVLMALQKKGSGQKGKRRGSPRATEKGRGEEVVADYVDVRDISIRSDWGVRLDEMERRLKELHKLEEEV